MSDDHEYEDPFVPHQDRGSIDLLVWVIVLPILLAYVFT